MGYKIFDEYTHGTRCVATAFSLATSRREEKGRPVTRPTRQSPGVTEESLVVTGAVTGVLNHLTSRPPPTYYDLLCASTEPSMMSMGIRLYTAKTPSRPAAISHMN